MTWKHRCLSVAILGVAALILSGCSGYAQPHEQHWVSTGGNGNDFNNVKYQCLKESAIPPTYNPATYHTTTTNNELFMACMGAHGFSWQ